MARAPFSTTISERVNIAAGVSPAETNTRCSGCSMTVARRDMPITAPSPMKRGVERDRRIALDRHHLAEMRDRSAHRRPPAPAPSAGCVRPGSSAGEIGQFRRKDAVDKDNAAAIDIADQPAGSLGPRQRRRHRAALPSGLASRISARRSVYFHSSTRRCGSPCAANRSNACARSVRLARQARLRLVPFGRERKLGGGFQDGYVSHCISSFTSPRLRGEVGLHVRQHVQFG